MCDDGEKEKKKRKVATLFPPWIILVMPTIQAARGTPQCVNNDLFLDDACVVSPHVLYLRMSSRSQECVHHLVVPCRRNLLAGMTSLLASRCVGFGVCFHHSLHLHPHCVSYTTLQRSKFHLHLNEKLLLRRAGIPSQH